MVVVAHNGLHYFLTWARVFVQGVVKALVSIVIGLIGYQLMVYKSPVSFYMLAIGIPMVLIGIGLLINSVWSVLLVSFSHSYNKGVCRLC